MCIIMLDIRNNTEKLDREILERCQEKNPDGMGIMYAYEDILYTWSTLKDFEAIWNAYTRARGYGMKVAIHFRIGTKGTETLDNCHPFNITDHFAFMHNGTITWLGSLGDKKSDSRYIRDIFQDLPDGWLGNKGIRAMVKDSVTGDRLVFMDEKGGHDIINEFGGFWHKGDWRNGVWFSHGKNRTFITTGKEVFTNGFRPREGWGGDNSGNGLTKENGHLLSCKCSTCEPAITDHVESCSCLECKRIRAKADKIKPLLRKQRTPVSTVLAILPDHMDLYTRRGYPQPGREIAENLLFGYGSFRKDLGAMGIPDELIYLGKGILEGASLWAVEVSNFAQAGAMLEAHRTDMMIKGDVYSMNTTDLSKVLKELDTVEGCEYGDPEASAYHRFIMPVTLASDQNGAGGKVWCWTYMMNPELAEDDVIAPVPFGDWGRYLDGLDKEEQEAANKAILGDTSLRTVTSETGVNPCPKCKSKDTLTEIVRGPDKLLGMTLMHSKKIMCMDCEKETVIHIAN